MISIIKKIINPIEILRAIWFHKNQKKHIKSSEDLELMLYSKIIRNDMLHYGYFDDIHIHPDTISIKDLENAQMKYVEIIIEQILDKNNKILDVGCGMGGLSNILFNNGYKVESLTPDDNQKNYINSKYKNLTVHHMRFEDFKIKKEFGTIINSESLQYIDLDKAFDLIPEILLPNGRWIITDYFRINDNGINHSGHLHNDFLSYVEKRGWKIVYQNDMTQNALPTLKFAMIFINRFIKPLTLFANQKLKYKQAWLFYLTDQLRLKISKKSEKELAALNPEKFAKEKKYMLYVLERK
tara:strand:- start:6262 stop:7152 length:891 start_codon:yes stop_codon:yes gene_type:complete